MSHEQTAYEVALDMYNSFIADIEKFHEGTMGIVEATHKLYMTRNLLYPLGYTLNIVGGAYTLVAQWHI